MIGFASLQTSRSSNYIDIPLPPPKFYGRTTELPFYVDALCTKPEPKAAAICGTGGIGKTALASKILHHPDIETRFDTRRFFITCEHMLNVDSLILKLVDTLLTEPLDGDVDTTTVETLASRLGQQSLLTIVCLDNFETMLDIDEIKARTVLRALLKCPILALLVTMRAHLPPVPDVRWLKTDVLKGLDTDAASSYFKDSVNFTDLAKLPDQTDVDKLLKRLDGHPLCLMLIAYQVEQDQDVVQTLKRYDESVRMLNLSRRTTSKLESLDVSLQLSYSSTRMTDQSRLLFRLLSYLPSGLERRTIPDVLRTSDADDEAQDLINAALVTFDRVAGSMYVHMIISTRFNLMEYCVS